MFSLFNFCLFATVLLLYKYYLMFIICKLSNKKHKKLANNKCAWTVQLFLKHIAHV